MSYDLFNKNNSNNLYISHQKVNTCASFYSSIQHMIQKENFIDSRQINKNKAESKSRSWLKSTLNIIEDSVAMDASFLIEQSRNKNTLIQNIKKGNQKEKARSLDELRYEQIMIREKLKEIKKLERNTKLSKKQFKNAQKKVKTNSELRQLTKKYREFKERLVQKSQMIKIEEQEYKEKAWKLQEQKIKTQCQERRKVIEETLKKMEERRVKRQEQLKAQKSKLKRLRKQKLFQKMKDNYNKKMNELNEQKIENYRKIKKEYSLDISNLSMHQKKYDELRHDKEEKRTMRMTESRVLPQIHHYKSRFLDQVIENDRVAKERELEIMLRAREMKRKHREYEERVLSEFAPPVREHSEDDEDKENKKIALDRQEIRKKGNQLYQQGQKLVIPLEKRQRYQKQKQLKLKSLTPKAYPNYLPQITHKLSQSPSKSNSYQNEIRKLKAIVQDKRVKKEDKIEEVRMTIEKMEYSYVPNKDLSQDQILKRLNAKLELLELLQ